MKPLDTDTPMSIEELIKSKAVSAIQIGWVSKSQYVPATALREFMEGKVLVDAAVFKRICEIAINWEIEEFGHSALEMYTHPTTTGDKP